MPYGIISLIIINVLMTSAAQLVLKAGMKNYQTEATISVATILSSLFHPLVILGLAIYFFSTLLWLAILSKVDVSFAYPFVGLGFIVTMVFGHLLYGEELSGYRIAGTLLIVMGIVVLSQSASQRLS